MTSFTEKNESRRPLGTPGSRERRQWQNARIARRRMNGGAFGLLRHSSKTVELYDELAYGTRGAKP